MSRILDDSCQDVKARQDVDELLRLLGGIANGFDPVPINAEDAERFKCVISALIRERDEAFDGLRTLNSEGLRRAQIAEGRLALVRSFLEQRVEV